MENLTLYRKFERKPDTIKGELIKGISLLQQWVFLIRWELSKL